MLQRLSTAARRSHASRRRSVFAQLQEDQARRRQDRALWRDEAALVRTLGQACSAVAERLQDVDGETAGQLVDLAAEAAWFVRRLEARGARPA